MDGFNWAIWLAVAALIVASALFARLVRRSKRLSRLADEAMQLRIQAEATEKRNRQIKQELTNNIAHELKTPVSSIRGYLEIMLGDAPLDEARRRHFLERCYSQTLRLSNLIQDVSLINKLEESADLFPPNDTDLHLALREAVDDLTLQAQGKSISLSDSLPESMPMVGNKELLYCIFRNLLENTIAYAGVGVTASVSTYKSDPEFYYIHYSDNGCGVPDEYLSRLFDRFVRIGEGRSRSDGGTGLGLSIVKHAVIFHGGEIYARNCKSGGLEFFFSIRKKSPSAHHGIST